MTISDIGPWRVAGSYYEVCNCDAVCPCRRQGGRASGRSSYGVCDFALSWQIREGAAGTLPLAGLAVVLAGRYSDDEPGTPWRVVLYLDQRADAAQQAALTAIFLGRAGGTPLRNFAAVIGEVYAVRTAPIALDHTPQREQMRVGDFVAAYTATAVQADEAVSCGIPGHDHPGQEIVAARFWVEDAPLRWEVRGRCGFATTFAYASDA